MYNHSYSSGELHIQKIKERTYNMDTGVLILFIIFAVIVFGLIYILFGR